MDLENENKTENWLNIVKEIQKAVEEGLLKCDEENEDSIIIYRNGSNTAPEGWYVENIYDIASELATNEGECAEFSISLDKARMKMKEEE